MRKYRIYYADIHDIAVQHPELMRISDVVYSEGIPHDDVKEWIHVTTVALTHCDDNEIIVKIEKIS